MKTKKKTNPLASQLNAAMEELERAMRSGKPARELFTVRSVTVVAPSTYDAKTVRSVRSSLCVSQGVFAKLIGVSPELVENWEQGISEPRGTACRLLDEIRRNPSDFLARHAGPATATSPRRAG